MRERKRLDRTEHGTCRRLLLLLPMLHVAWKGIRRFWHQQQLLLQQLHRSNPELWLEARLHATQAHKAQSFVTCRHRAAELKGNKSFENDLKADKWV